jgi:hypothetical protein
MRPRLHGILARYGRALFDSVANREPSVARRHTVESLIAHFAEADPAINKSSTQWLVLSYIAGGFRFEDLGKATDTLALFRRKRHRLPVERRDLSRYARLSDVWSAVKQFAEPDAAPQGRDSRHAQRDLARSESVFLVERDDLTIVVPLTEFAATWWGRGTRWCTAATHDNAFQQYHAMAPLFVIVKDGRKYQFHASRDECQFMDADDAPVTREAALSMWNDVKPLVVWGIKQNDEVLEYADEKDLDRATWLDLVSLSGYKLDSVPSSMLDRAMCESAVRQDGLALQHVPRSLRDRRMCRLAVESNGMALRMVPTRLVDADMCRAAVENDGAAFRFVPMRLQTMALVRLAVRGGCGRELLPVYAVTRDVFLEMVASHPIKLRIVPEEYLDRHLCQAAVERGGSLLRFVPDRFRDEAMCRIAVASSGYALEFVPVEMRDYAMCLEAVRRNGGALRCVPERHKDRAMCEAATLQDGYAMFETCDPFRRDMFTLALSRSRSMLDEIGATMIEDWHCAVAVQADGLALEFVPGHLRKPDLCRSAVERNGAALAFVPMPLRDRNICEAAVANCEAAVAFVPGNLQHLFRRPDPGVMHPHDWKLESLDDIRQELNRLAARHEPFQAALAA